MTKTTNYQLPQWEATDPVRRENFNQAMANIDSALKAKADQTALEAYRAGSDAAVAALESKLTSTSGGMSNALTQTKQELTAEISAVQTAAEAAQTAADAAQASADAAWSPQNPPFVVGSYYGTGVEELGTQNKITVGFTPSLIFIASGTSCYFAIGPDQGSISRSSLTWDSDGVTLTHADPEYRLDIKNTRYYYCAFR